MTLVPATNQKKNRPKNSRLRTNTRVKMITLIKLIEPSTSENMPTGKKAFYSHPAAMSKKFRLFLLTFAAGMMILQFFYNASGQDIEATISFDKTSPTVVHVNGKFVKARRPNEARHLSFLQSYARVEQVGERVSGVTLADSEGSPIKFRRLMAGEYVAESDFREWSYTIDLKPFRNAFAAGHVSWRTGDVGVLFLTDLLPLTRDRASAKLTLITRGGSNDHQWSDPDSDGSHLSYEDKDKGVVFIGGKAGTTAVRDLGTTRWTVFLGDDLGFTRADVLSIVDEVFSVYGAKFGSAVTKNALLTIRKFPVPIEPG